MYPITSGTSQPANLFASGSASNVRPLFGKQDKPPTKSVDGVNPPAETTPATDTLETANKPDDNKSAFDIREEAKVAQAILFGNVIPIATCFLWLGGPIPGLAGTVVAWLAGRQSRKLRKSIQANRLEVPTQQLDKLAAMLQDPSKLEAGALFGHFNEMMTQVGDARLRGLSRFILPAMKMAYNGALRLFKSIPFLRWIPENINKLKIIDEKGAQVFTQAGKKGASEALEVVARKLFKGFSINLRVAREDNPFKAAFAGLTGLFWWTLGLAGIPLELGLNYVKGKLGMGEKKSPEKPTA